MGLDSLHNSKSWVTQIKEKTQRLGHIEKINKIRQGNIEYVLKHFEDEIIANYASLWVLVREMEPRVVDAGFDLGDLVHRNRAKNRDSFVNVPNGSIVVEARTRGSLNGSFSPIILTVEEVSLNDFLP